MRGATTLLSKHCCWTPGPGRKQGSLRWNTGRPRAQVARPRETGREASAGRPGLRPRSHPRNPAAVTGNRAGCSGEREKTVPVRLLSVERGWPCCFRACRGATGSESRNGYNFRGYFLKEKEH